MTLGDLYNAVRAKREADDPALLYWMFWSGYTAAERATLRRLISDFGRKIRQVIKVEFDTANSRVNLEFESPPKG